MKSCFFSVITLLLACITSNAQSEEGFKLPPKEIVEVLTAPSQPQMVISPLKKYIALIEKPSGGLPLAKMAESKIPLAGLNFSPETNFIAQYPSSSKLRIKKADASQDFIRIDGMPTNPSIFDVKWSPLDDKLAFCNIVPGRGVELWIIELSKQKAKRLGDFYLNFSLDEYKTYEWSAKGTSLICPIVLPKRGSMPSEKAIYKQPVSQEHSIGMVPSRTYQGLLKNIYDEKLLDYFATSQLILVTTKGAITNIGKPCIVMDFAASPDGKFILINNVLKPYSYSLTYHRFPSQVNIFSSNGELVKVLDQLPTKIRAVGRDGTYNTPRNYSWRADHRATIFWVEPLDDGDPSRSVPFRDKLVTLEAPFTGIPKCLYQTSLRFNSIYWINDSISIVTEKMWSSRTMKWVSINPTTALVNDTLASFASDSFLESPGEIVMENSNSNSKALFLDSSIYLSAYSYDKTHKIIPILKKWNLVNNVVTTIWRSTPPYFDTFIAWNELKDDKSILISRQSNEIPKNIILYDLISSESRALTNNKDENEALKQINQQKIFYEREDGVQLYANLYYPKGTDKSKRLPSLLWAYPIEYISKKTADEVVTSPYLYKGNYSLQKLLATQGFVVIDNASFPILAQSNQEPNDKYLEQLYLNAKAAILAGYELGVVDSSKVAIAGHSYGAFMAANLLTHTNLFKAGIAQSGAYNRSLTPFGFQAEARNYWQAQQLYHKVSPFQNINQLQYPILLIHGQNDDNPGTHLLQSERYYEALKGMGKRSRLVVLPYEAHTYEALENRLHVCWEMINWMNKYLKNEPVDAKTTNLQSR
jgi:predicted esterase